VGGGKRRSKGQHTRLVDRCAHTIKKLAKAALKNIDTEAFGVAAEGR
jgi:hypothetical protein